MEAFNPELLLLLLELYIKLLRYPYSETKKGLCQVGIYFFKVS